MVDRSSEASKGCTMIAGAQPKARYRKSEIHSNRRGYASLTGTHIQRSARWPSMCGAGISRVLFAQRRRMLSRSPAHASETDHSPLLRSAEAVRGGQKRYLRKTETHSVACAGISRGSFGHGAKRSRVCDNAKIERPAASPQRFRKDFVPRRS
jgi:hypothetical protein